MRAIFKVLPLLAGLIIATGCSEDPTQPKETVAPTIASDSWELAIGGSAYDRTYGVAVDYLGNVFIAGSFFNTIDLGGETLDAAAGRAFIAKYDPDGELIWASQISGNSGNPLHVSTDGAGNLVVTGLFLGDLTLGPVTLSNAIGSVHVFIAKYSAAGDVMWTDHDIAGYMSYGLDTATDGNGMTVITGLINVGATFGDIELKSTGVDFFVVAYNTAGVAQWAQQTSGSEGRAAAVDDAGNVFVAGNFSQKTTFGDTDLVSAGRNDIFIVKFNSAGVVQWAIRLGGDEHDQAVAITTDQAGDVLLAGNIAGETIGMWKFSGDGSPLWQIDTPYIHSMTTDASNNVVVAGSHRSTVTIGSDELIGRGLGDAFVASYNSMGIPLWALSAGGPKEDRAVGIDLTPDGNPVVTGNFWDTIFFGEKTFTSRGEQDVFVFQLD